MGFPPLLMSKHSKQLAALDRRRERIGWKARRPRAFIGASASYMGYGATVAAAAEVSVRKRARSRSTASSRRPIPDTPSIPRDRGPDRGLVRLRSSALFHAASRSRTGGSNSRISNSYDSLRIKDHAQGPSPSSCPAAVSGAESASDDLRRGSRRAQRLFAATGRRIRHVPLKDANIAFV